MAKTVRSLVGDQRVLAILDDTPRTATEITALLRLEVLESWAEEQGFEIDWNTPTEPAGARLLAHSSAARRGMVTLNTDQVSQKLNRFARTGQARKLSSPTGRGHLWLRAD